MNDKVRPEFHEDKFLIQNGRHPCLLSIDFIPNTVDISKNKVILLTGPNMGGKSTLLRMVCLLSVLAQMGCYVTAEKYECSLVDRIFTRIGASDRLELGKSTFFTEM
jgi:DNA mismatch repair protein MSH6